MNAAENRSGGAIYPIFDNITFLWYNNSNKAGKE